MSVHHSLDISIISASAGSGKTYRLSQEMLTAIRSGDVRPEAIIATTFTEFAAKELKERVYKSLLSAGMFAEADAIGHALIGTVHSIGAKLLQRFAFELGVPPQLTIMGEEDSRHSFNNALASIQLPDAIHKMDHLSLVMGFNQTPTPLDWRKIVQQITEIARSNDFSEAVLQESKKITIANILSFLETPTQTADEWNNSFFGLLNDTIEALQSGEDKTKTTEEVVNTLKEFKTDFTQRKNTIIWYWMAKIQKSSVGAKSREVFEPLKTMAKNHVAHPTFHQDITDAVTELFDWSIKALDEYENYKRHRGLIDYADMEAKVSQLLRMPSVARALGGEIDLLLVDEFQDTNPIQLDIFLQLSQIAKSSIWVGDPKQSIYGFRGAEPSLMKSVIAATGGIKAENILSYSFRSRKDLVYFSNAIFSNAFKDLPVEQIALEPRRDELFGLKNAIQIWNFTDSDAEKRKPAKPWTQLCIATALKELLESDFPIVASDKVSTRAALPGDIAILCRRNDLCVEMAEMLNNMGFRTAIPRVGLMETAEAKLVAACLKFLVNPSDTLALTEIRVLAAGDKIEDLIADRTDFLRQKQESNEPKTGHYWSFEHPIIQKINSFRYKTSELSTGELLDILLNEFDLQRIVSTWGDAHRRLANLDILRKNCKQYETNCQRLHQASSITGFLLWLDSLALEQKDNQGAVQDPQAINIMTYHRSKGLEWPIVICMDLEAKLKDDILGKFEIINQSSETDFNQILANRYIRYWINPYALQKDKTTYLTQIQESPIFQDHLQSILAEEARLLYVALTRARDYLILPKSNYEPTKWLNRVFHEGDESAPTLTLDDHNCLCTWENHAILADITEYDVRAKINTSVANFEETSSWWAAPQTPIPVYAKEMLSLIDEPSLGKSLIFVQSFSIETNLNDCSEIAEANFSALKRLILSGALWKTVASQREDFNKNIVEELIEIQPKINMITADWYSFLATYATHFETNIPFFWKNNQHQILSTSIDIVGKNTENTVLASIVSSNAGSEQNALLELALAKRCLTKNETENSLLLFTYDPLQGIVKQWK